MKKTLITVVQVIVTVLLLAWLFRDQKQNHEMLQALSRANLLWILAAIACYGGVLVAAIIRWQILLRVQEVKISWARLSALFMIGVLFNPFLPGGTGGDVIKIFYLLKEAPDKKAPALLAVLIDRVVGMFGLVLIAGLVVSARYQWLTRTPAASGLLYTLLLILGGSFAFIILSFVITGFGLVHKLPARMPMRDKLVELSVAYSHYGRAWGSTIAALLLCVPIHLGSFTLFYCVAQAFREAATKASLFDFWGIMPIANTIACIPISIGGTGVREGLFVKLLGGLCDIPESIAKLVSLTGYSVLVFWALIGGVVYLLYRPSEHAKLAQIEKEVSSLEHEIATNEEAP